MINKSLDRILLKVFRPQVLLAALICWQLLLLPAEALISSKYYSYRPPSFDGIGKFYMGREISDVLGHQGADWLERKDRKTEEQPQKLVSALALKPADVVADVGAGSGYISKLLATQVPKGKVIAIDLQPEMLALIKQRKIANIEPHLGTEQSPELAVASIDLAVMVDAYHEFSYPREMMAGIVAALKPGGRVVLAEYRGEDPLVFIKPHHKTTQKQIRQELEAVGLKWQKTESVLPQQHLMFFGKGYNSFGSSLLRTHDVMGQIEYDSILPFPHLGNKDRSVRDRVFTTASNLQISPPTALKLLLATFLNRHSA
jgi:ubiquinone/menaquinone biosynthesis C-methylase UbiE